MPAAAVIPAPIAYSTIAVAKKLIVGSRGRERVAVGLTVTSAVLVDCPLSTRRRYSLSVGTACRARLPWQN